MNEYSANNQQMPSALMDQVFEALRELTVPPEPAKRPIGFVTPEEKKNKPAGKAASKATARRRV